MSHTPGKWSVTSPRAGEYVGSAWVGEQCIARFCEPVAEENLARAVTCVNVCDGISSAELDLLTDRGGVIALADLALQACIELRHCAEVFRMYESQHLMKFTDEGNDKAAMNGNYAARIEKLIEGFAL